MVPQRLERVSKLGSPHFVLLQCFGVIGANFRFRRRNQLLLPANFCFRRYAISLVLVSGGQRDPHRHDRGIYAKRGVRQFSSFVAGRHIQIGTSVYFLEPGVRNRLIKRCPGCLDLDPLGQRPLDPRASLPFDSPLRLALQKREQFVGRPEPPFAKAGRQDRFDGFQLFRRIGSDVDFRRDQITVPQPQGDFADVLRCL